MMSYAEYSQHAPAGVARVGADLQAARHQLGWSLEDVAASLRIRLPHLEAIEEGRIRDLPGNAYAVGFVRTYASALGFNPDEVARRFKAEAHEVNRKTELSFPAPVPQRGVPAMAVVLLGILVAGGAYVGWYRYSGSAAPEHEQVSTPLPDRLAALAPSLQPAVPALPSAAPPGAGMPASSAMAPAPVALAPPPAPPAVIAPPAPMPAAAPAATRLVLFARAGGWVQVKEKQGQILLNRVLHTGESWPVPMKPNLLLTTSNAGGMDLMVDGVATAKLGAPGGFAHDIALDPDALKAGPPKPAPRPVYHPPPPKPAISPDIPE